jgi:hypothetical protein
MTHPHADEIVAAIRAHEKIGRGSCSPVDECYSDDELVEAFGYAVSRTVSLGVTDKPLTVRGAVNKAIWYHDLWADRMADIVGFASW